MKIYIAGKMRGEKCFGFERFFYWAHVWRLAGWEPLNPAEVDCEKMLKGWTYSSDQYEDVLAYDLKLIEEQADAVFMMSNWQESEGATREHTKAVELGIEIKYEDNPYRTLQAEL
jgi:hypothetical protein